MGSDKSLIAAVALACVVGAKGIPMALSGQDDTPEARQVLIEAMQQDAGGDVAALADAARAREAGAGDDLLRDLYAAVWRAGLAATDEAQRQAAVAYLVEKAGRQQGYLRDLALRLLLSFRKADFSAAGRAALAAMARHQLSPGLARVIGVAEAEEAIPALRAAADGAFAGSTAALKADPAWAAALALARLGDRPSLERIRDRVFAEDDIVLRATQLLPDLAYTKVPAAFDLLRHYLDSFARLPTLKPTQSKGEREAAHAAKVILANTSGGPDVQGLDDDALVRAVKAWVDQLAAWPIVR